MKKGFVISWFYPPGNSSEGLVTYKLLKNSKLSYDVFTKDSGVSGAFERATTETDLVSPNINIICGSSHDRNKWIDEAVEYYATHQNEYGFIMSRAMPPECHEVALRIKNINPSVKWIASFGDPLVRTPYVDVYKNNPNPHTIKAYLDRGAGAKDIIRAIVSPYRLAESLHFHRQRKHEKKIAARYKNINDSTFEQADRLVFNNELQLEHAFAGEHEQYRKKAEVIPHSFEETYYPAKKTPTGKKLNFVFAGHLDNMRSASQLLRAVHQLKSSDHELAQKVSFNFYGNMPDSDKLFIMNSQIYDVVTLHDPVQYLDSLKLMSGADWLVNIDANLATTMPNYIFLPAKLIDYFGAETPIFNITSLTGASANAVRAIGSGVCVSHSANEIYLYLSKIIYGGFKLPAPLKNELKKYNAKTIASAFDELVKSLNKQIKSKHKK